MEHQVMWTPWDGLGLEHLRLAQRHGEIVADGIILGVEHGAAFRLRYEIRCDARWRMRRVTVESLTDAQALRLTADGTGRWFDGSGRALAQLDGCLDVDLSATPFTNTLPIRRLALPPGTAVELKVAYITLPAMRVTFDKQKYTCLERRSGGGRYRFESLDSEFMVELPVDADGLVEDYPELFRRVWSA